MAPEHVAKETPKIMTPKVAEKKGPQQRLDIPRPEQSTTVWGKTGILVNRLRQEGKVEDRGGEFYYVPLGKPLIHSDSHILGGIYFGAGGQREAIVVDLDYKPSEILRLYDIAKKKVVQNATANKKMTEGLVMRAIYDTVREEIRPDEKMVEAIIERKGGKNDGLIALDVFIKNKAGECRHFALACGALFELFKKNWKGTEIGTVSVDRNADERGAHGWCRYTNSNGVVFIVDAAHGVLLPLEQAALKFEKKEIKWDYRRPEDRF